MSRPYATHWGGYGTIRCDAGGRWDVDTAVTAISRLDRAADGLQYVEQPCRTVGEIAAVRGHVEVRIAARVPERLPGPGIARAADIAVLSCGPLGGVRRCLRLADACGLPCIVSSAGETSIGLAAGVALAGALPEFTFASRLGTRSLLTGDLVTEARTLLPVDGHLPVAPMPPAPDFERLERYAVTDSHRLAWWRARLRMACDAL